MKRMIAMLLALMLTVGMLALTVSAESPKGESDTVEAPVITIGEGELGSVEIKQYAEEGAVGEVQIEQYAEEEGEAGEVQIEQYAEEETGFFAWLKNLWRSILNFFGL